MITDTEAEHLRTLVPDDPIKLPADHLACQGCGVAVPGRAPTTKTVTPSPSANSARRDPEVEFSRCTTCQAVLDQAEAYVAERPAMVTRHGSFAVERVASTLFALTVLDRPGPGAAATAPTAPRPRDVVLVAAHADPGHVQSAPVGTRDAYPARRPAGRLRRRALRPGAAGCPARDAPCLRLACLFCGIASVQRSAAEVARRGGPDKAAEYVWTRVTTTATALGIRGPRRMVGDVCPDCARALEQTGAVGLEARAQALASYVARTSMKKAERLRDLVEGQRPPTLPAWAVAVSPLRPNARPWAHLRRVVDRL